MNSKMYGLDMFSLSNIELMNILDIADEDIVMLKLKHGKAYHKEIGTIEQFSRAIAKMLNNTKN